MSKSKRKGKNTINNESLDKGKQSEEEKKFWEWASKLIENSDCENEYEAFRKIFSTDIAKQILESDMVIKNPLVFVQAKKVYEWLKEKFKDNEDVTIKIKAKTLSIDIVGYSSDQEDGISFTPQELKEFSDMCSLAEFVIFDSTLDLNEKVTPHLLISFPTIECYKKKK